MQTIGIDVREAAVSEPAGKALYARHLVEALLPLLQGFQVILYSDQPLPNSFHIPESVQVRIVRWPGLLWHLAVLFRIVFLDRVLTYLSPTSTILPAVSSRCLPVIHDLVAFQASWRHQAKATWIERLTVPFAVRRARHILTVSEATMRDVMKRFGLPADRFAVATPACGSPSVVLDAAQLAKILARYDLETQSYFLFVSTLEPRKNVERLIEAYARLRQRRPEGVPPLVIVGKTGWHAQEILDAPARFGVTSYVRFLGYVSSGEMPALYAGALAFAFPSLYEGFGMTVLEAMIAGVPVLTSNTSSLPEVAGGAGLLVDPLDVPAISAGLEKLMDDAGLRARLSTAGREQAQTFSWKASAECVEGVIKKTMHFSLSSVLVGASFRAFLPFALATSLLAILGAAIAVVFLGWLGVPLVLGAIVFCGILLASLWHPKIGVYVIAFLLPFERIGSVDLGGITIRASQVVLLAALLGWVMALLFRRERLRMHLPTYVPMVLFLAIAVLSLTQAENLMRGILVLVFTVFVMMLPLLLPNVLRTPADIRKVVSLLLLSAALTSAFGLYQFAGDMLGLPPEITGLREKYTKDVFGFPRVQSTALEPLYFANYLLIPLAIVLVSFLFRRPSRGRPFLRPLYAFPLLMMMLLALVLTLSRGGFLAAGALASLVFGVWVLDGVHWRRILLLAAAGATALGGAYGALLLTGKEKNVTAFVEQATTFTEGVGALERFSTYDQAGRLFLDHPWLGVGIGNFGPAVASTPWTQPEGGWLIVNNEYLELLAEMGVPGLLAFLAIIVTLVLSSVRSLREGKDPALRLLLFAFLAALFGILVQYQTFSILFILHIWFAVGMILAVQQVLVQKASTVAKT